MFDPEQLKKMLKEYVNGLIDALNKFILGILLILIILTFFIHNFFLDLLKIILLIIFIFRVVSKNRLKRQKENEIFLSIIHAPLKPFENWTEKKNFVFKKCPKCKTILKLPLPKKSGINHAKCPNCGNRVTIINIRHKKKEKVEVEVIKKKK